MTRTAVGIEEPEEPEDESAPSLLELAQAVAVPTPPNPKDELAAKRKAAIQAVDNEKQARQNDHAAWALHVLSPHFSCKLNVECMYSSRLIVRLPHLHGPLLFLVNDLFLTFSSEYQMWSIIGINEHGRLQSDTVSKGAVNLEMLAKVINSHPDWSFDQSRVRGFLFD